MRALDTLTDLRRWASWINWCWSAVKSVWACGTRWTNACSFNTLLQILSYFLDAPHLTREVRSQCISMESCCSTLKSTLPPCFNLTARYDTNRFRPGRRQACSKEQKWAPANKAGELLSEIRGSLTRSHPQWRSDVFLLRRSQLIGLFCYSSRSAAWHTNVKWENSMCKARWDANRKEELPPDEIQRGGNAYRIFWDRGQGWCLMPSQLCCC